MTTENNWGKNSEHCMEKWKCEPRCGTKTQKTHY